MHHFAPSRLVQRDGRVVTKVEVGCDGRGGLAGRAWPTRTAKSCGPGAPTLALSLADDDPRMMGARQPGPRARRTPLKPLRREGRLIRLICGDRRVLFLLHAGHGCQSASGLPCALSFSEGHAHVSLGRTPAARMRTTVSSAVCSSAGAFSPREKGYAALPWCLNMSAVRFFSSPGATSSMCLPRNHWLPAGSFTPPERSP
jgi:hypothetical protein